MDDLNSEGAQQTQETNLPDKSKGLFYGPRGDFSSGRFIKVFSFFVACALAIILSVKLFTATKENPVDPTLVNSLIWVCGAFLGVSTSSEIVQKITHS